MSVRASSDILYCWYILSEHFFSFVLIAQDVDQLIHHLFDRFDSFAAVDLLGFEPGGLFLLAVEAIGILLDGLSFCFSSSLSGELFQIQKHIFSVIFFFFLFAQLLKPDVVSSLVHLHCAFRVIERLVATDRK